MHTYVEVGNSPILFTVPHDGGLKFADRPMLTKPTGRDLGTLPLALACRDRLIQLKRRPTIVWFDLHRFHADPNRSQKREAFASGFEEAYHDFHNRLAEQAQAITAAHDRSVHIDFHGCYYREGSKTWDLILGTHTHKTAPGGSDVVFAQAMSQLVHPLLEREYACVFSPDPANGMDGRYSGGWIVGTTAAQFAAKGLDSIQVEFNSHLRQASMTNVLAEHIASTLAAML